MELQCARSNPGNLWLKRYLSCSTYLRTKLVIGEVDAKLAVPKPDRSALKLLRRSG